MKLKPQSSPKELLETQLEEMRQERSALSQELTLLLTSRNATKRELQAEGEKLMEELRRVEKDCLIQKDTLLTEIISLEERRKVALMPLTERKARLDAQEAAIKSKEEEVSKQEKENQAYQAVLAEKMAQLSDIRAELNERELEIIRKEKKIEVSLQFHVKSSEALANKWQEFREYEAKRTSELDKKAESLDFQEKANEKERSFNENEKKRLQDLKSDIDSRRLALRQAEKMKYAQP